MRFIRIILSSGLFIFGFQGLSTQDINEHKKNYNTIDIPDTIGSIKELDFHLKKGDLLLLDIDNTILIGKKKDETLLLESDFKETLRALEERGVTVLFLTARQDTDKTIEQLKHADILPKIQSENMQFKNIPFKSGIIFAPDEKSKNEEKGENKKNKSTKGPVLTNFLKTVNLQYKNLFFVDDLEDNISSVKEAFNEFDKEKKHYAIKIISNQSIFDYSPSDQHVEFPKNIFDMTYKESIHGGGGGVHVLLDKQNTKWILKCGSGDLNHFKEELASDLVTAILLKAPAFAIYKNRPKSVENKKCDGPIYRLTKFIEKSGENEKIAKSFQDRFVGDAFLSNWDGTLTKNVINSQNGLISIDHGGGLRYRSTNGVKKTWKNSWDPYVVTDIMTLINLDTEKHGYSEISLSSIKKQIDDLLNEEKFSDMLTQLNRLHSSIHIQNFSELSYMLKSRKLFLEYLRDKITKSEEGENSNTSQQGNTKNLETLLKDDLAKLGETSAGTLIYTYINKEPYVLLGKRIKHEWYGNLGGKSDKEDIFLAVTAARETIEESMGLIDMRSIWMLYSPYVDFSESSKKYRTYFIQRPYVSASDLNKKIKELNQGSTQKDKPEYTEFVWVSMKNLKETLNKKAFKSVNAHSKESTIEDMEILTYDEEKAIKKTIKLHAPFIASMKQEKSIDILKQIIWNQSKPWGPVQTQGSNEKLSFGQTATGEIYQVKNGQKIFLSPEDEEKNSSKLILNHVEVMRDIKKRKNDEPEENEYQKTFKETPYTQSRAFLLAILGEKYKDKKDDELLFEFFKQKSPGLLENLKSKADFRLKPYIQCLKTEEENKDKIFLYHATTDQIGMLYDLYTELRNILMISNQEGVLIRGVDNDFKQLQNIHDFIKEQMQLQQSDFSHLNNYKSDFEKAAISTNLFLTGNYDTESSYTISYFEKNTSRTTVDFPIIIKSIFTALNIHDDDFNKEIQNDLSNIFIKSGRLFQFQLNPEIADDWAYSAKFMGKGVEFTGIKDKENYYGIRVPILHIRNGNRELPNHKKKLELNQIQARLFLSPKLFMNNGFKSYSYWTSNAEEEKINTYKKGMIKIANKIAKKILDSKTWISNKYIKREQGQEQTIIQQLQSILFKDKRENIEGLNPKEYLDVKNIEDNYTKKNFDHLKMVLKEQTLTPQDTNKILIILCGNASHEYDFISDSHRHFALEAMKIISEKSNDAKEIVKKFIQEHFAQTQKSSLVRSIDSKFKDGEEDLLSLDELKFLIDNGAEIKNEQKKTLLMHVIDRKDTNLEIVQDLVEKKNYNIYAEDEKGNIALTYAFRHLDIAKYLLDKSLEKQNLTDENINKILDTLCGKTNSNSSSFVSKEHLNFAIEQLKNIANKNDNYDKIVTKFIKEHFENKSTLTRLIKRITTVEGLKFLIEKKGPQKGEKTLLMYILNMEKAHKLISLESVKKILEEKKEDINAEDEDKKTALMYALEMKSANLDIINHLIEKGANINAKDKDQKTALMYALEMESANLDIINHLIEKGAEINAKDEDNKTVLMYAARSPKLDIIKYLIEKGADIHKQDKQKRTATNYFEFSHSYYNNNFKKEKQDIISLLNPQHNK